MYQPLGVGEGGDDYIYYFRHYVHSDMIRYLDLYFSSGSFYGVQPIENAISPRDICGIFWELE